MEGIRWIRGEKPSTKTMQQRKSIGEKEICRNCNKIFDKKNIEIEHFIPVTIGGNIDEYYFYCTHCHKKKTNFDICYINFLKKCGFLIKIGPFEYEIINKIKLQECYLELKKLLKTG